MPKNRRKGDQNPAAGAIDPAVLGLGETVGDGESSGRATGERFELEDTPQDAFARVTMGTSASVGKLVNARRPVRCGQPAELIGYISARDEPRATRALEAGGIPVVEKVLDDRIILLISQA